ncbi:hypothetical protein B0H10DRAFT_535663 [Mycena sp. CBHHK59/15]|nr:hypothetical protein B0H10DRAFT_535663 [Mycena sp. CBHHK59/15]
MPNAPPLDIKPIAPKELTGKAARGGDAKWQLKYLPADTAEKFTNEVVPLACELAGIGTGSQWDNLTVAQVQTIVDRVYSTNKYVVRHKDVWTGLVRVNCPFCKPSMTTPTQIGYRLNDWHNGFGVHAEKVVQGYFEGDNRREVRRRVMRRMTRILWMIFRLLMAPCPQGPPLLPPFAHSISKPRWKSRIR